MPDTNGNISFRRRVGLILGPFGAFIIVGFFDLISGQPAAPPVEHRRTRSSSGPAN